MGVSNWRFWTAVGLCLVGVANCEPARKSVIVSLAAKWNETSFLAETSEFLASESDALFWKYVDRIGDTVDVSTFRKLTPEKIYEIAVKEAGAVLAGDASIDVLKFALAIRAHSPGVQLFQKLGEEQDGVKCDAFAEVNGKTTCNPSDLENFLSSAESSTSTVYSVDHIYHLGKNSEKTVIVYGELGSSEFLAFHVAAKALAKASKAKYVLRHFRRSQAVERVGLSGYGVELAIKNTEYKAVDDSQEKKDAQDEPDPDDISGFNFNVLKQLHPDVKESLEQFKLHLKEADQLGALKQWQVQDLAYQAAQRIVRSEPHEALNTLENIAQNFPLHARSLSREAVSDELRAEVEKNQQNALQDLDLEPGASGLFLNGIPIDVDSLDPFTLLDSLKKEEKLASGFFNMGFRREYLSILVNMDLSDEKSSYAVDYRDSFPFYLNNLDTDKQYRQWGNSVKLMLQPYYPGMIRPIARNLFTLIFIVNPAEKESRNLIKIAHSFYKHDIPIRIGLVFNVSDTGTGLEDPSVAVLNLFNFATVDSNIIKATGKLVELFESLTDRSTLTVDDVKKFFKKNYKDADVDDVFGADSDYDKGRQAGNAFLAKSALGSAPIVLLNGIPLDKSGVTGDRFEETVINEVMKITPKIQRAVLEGKLKDKDNVQIWLQSQSDVMPRLNKRILDAPSTKNYLDLTDVNPCKAKTLPDYLKLTDTEKSACAVHKAAYVARTDELATRAITLWPVMDLETEQGRSFAYAHLRHLKTSHITRVSFLHNPEDIEAACKPGSISSLVNAAFRLLPASQARQFVTKLVKEEFASKLLKKELTMEELAVGGMDIEAFEKERKRLSCDQLKMHAKYVTDVLRLSPGDRAVVANGLVIGPLESNESFDEEDLPLLEKLLVARGAEVIQSNIDKWEVEKEFGKSSDVVLRTSSLIGLYAAPKKRQWVVLAGDEHSTVTLVAEDNTRAAMDVVAVVDPLSRSAQRLAPFLRLLRSVLNCDLKLIMNPKAKLSELPLKRFFRFVLPSEPQFDTKGHVATPQAQFTGLPAKQLLTLSVIPPDAWMVEAVFADYDLDNLKMESVSGDVIAKFSLENILLEGHCFDDISGTPPRGLQYLLGTPSKRDIYDTIVMANLGYFQLKAAPGAWLLTLREGKSRSIYKITSHMNTEASVDDSTIRVLIDSFSGRVIRVRVQKREGMEDKNLLSDGDDESIWSTLANTVGASSGSGNHDTINIFSLASGHLYERFMRIMFLSVMKTAKHPVKFWLLKNYLSPQFKEILPVMAKKYGFDFELVEYKWPRWLHQQTEKQRVMWGYKILFLDVLFPLDLQKVIFVDADQVVRTDLIELMNLDLEGAPYGYTPFCDSRTSMDGFRFWRQGYWANHLAGRKYHISALYVIDLQKFRQIAAGDRLRGQYQGLSSDPNSLSNLDQDLPNNMIHQVRIKSLPQEWLWCETWCDDSSKTNAKTIDLCNNPLTKEPKLDSAARIIPEWKDYDEEIKEMIKEYKEGRESTGAPSSGKLDEEKEEGHKHGGEL